MTIYPVFIAWFFARLVSR